MFNPHTKFEVSTVARNEGMKRNAKCKNSRFGPLFWGLRGIARGSSTCIARWKAHCRFPVSDKRAFLLALAAKALLTY